MLIRPETPAAVEQEVADWNARQEASWGFMPNYAAAFASRPDVASAWGALNGAISKGMDRRRYEIATIAAARQLRSTYCTAAHSMFLRDEVGDEQSMTSLVNAPDGAGLDATDRAIVAFARKVADDASSIEQGDVDALRDAGLSDNEITDVVFAAAARSFFTKVLDGLGVQADFELGEKFDPAVRDQLVVGRPIADDH
jgi:uncharacterized peroxidase-related enzyme